MARVGAPFATLRQDCKSDIFARSASPNISTMGTPSTSLSSAGCCILIRTPSVRERFAIVLPTSRAAKTAAFGGTSLTRYREWGMISHDMDKWITGLFKDKAAAERAVDALQAAGYDVHDVSVMMSEDTRVRNFTMDAGSKAAEGATAGGIVGGAIGAVVAGLTATGSVDIVAASGV